MKKISLEELNRIAELSSLTIQEEQAETYANDLTKLMGLAEQISHLCDNLPAMEHPLDIKQPLRDDAPEMDYTREELLRLAPKSKAGLYTVPQVMQNHNSDSAPEQEEL